MQTLKVLTFDQIKDLCDEDKEIIFVYAQAKGRIHRIMMNLFVASLEVILLLFYLNIGRSEIDSLPFVSPVTMIADVVMWILIPLMVVVLLLYPFKAWELPAYRRGNQKAVEHFKIHRGIDIRKLSEKQILKWLFEVDKPFLG